MTGCSSGLSRVVYPRWMGKLFCPRDTQGHGSKVLSKGAGTCQVNGTNSRAPSYWQFQCPHSLYRKGTFMCVYLGYDHVSTVW